MKTKLRTKGGVGLPSTPPENASNALLEACFDLPFGRDPSIVSSQTSMGGREENSETSLLHCGISDAVMTSCESLSPSGSWKNSNPHPVPPLLCAGASRASVSQENGVSSDTARLFTQDSWRDLSSSLGKEMTAMSHALFVGIDVSAESNVVALSLADGHFLGKPRTFPNSLQGAKDLSACITDALTEQGIQRVLIGTESTGFLDLHLVDFLATCEALAPYHPEIYQFNPKVVRGFKQAYTDRDKTDPKDAEVIADRLRFGHLPTPYESHQSYLPLKRLTRYRFHLIQTLHREQQCFWQHLFLKFSALAINNPFAHPFTATCQAILEEFFSPDELVNMKEEALVAFLLQQSKGNFRDPKAVAEAVQKAARESYRLRPELAASVNLILGSMMQNIRALRNSVKEMDDAISKELAAFPNTLQSVPGIGPVYAAGIFAEIGDIKRFPNHASLAKFAGLTWRKSQSGHFTAEQTHLTKTGNEYLRYYLVEAANSLRIHNEGYKMFYQRKRKEVTKFQHKRALVLTARKLVRLIFSLLKKGQLYQRDYRA